MTATADPPGIEYVRAIYEAARSISHETRGELAGDLDGPTHNNPERRWADILHRREQAGVTATVQRAGNRVARVAGGGDRGRGVRRAVRNLVSAVKELADYVPEYGEGEHYVHELGEIIPFYVPEEGSADRLDGLRQRVFVRLVELEELLRDYPDPVARVLAVARRIAVRLLPTAEAARVGRWFERLEQDAG